MYGTYGHGLLWRVSEFAQHYGFNAGRLLSTALIDAVSGNVLATITITPATEPDGLLERSK